MPPKGQLNRYVLVQHLMASPQIVSEKNSPLVTEDEANPTAENYPIEELQAAKEQNRR